MCLCDELDWCLIWLGNLFSGWSALHSGSVHKTLLLEEHRRSSFKQVVKEGEEREHLTA